MKIINDIYYIKNTDKLFKITKNKKNENK